ncbi:MAG: zinc ribbon domain-containing protein [Burkholderiaceae bacterium]|jgi:putative FmdB family regulatory protein
MPIYEYACRQCGHQFETLVRSGSQPECPNCQSSELDKQLSVIAAPVVSGGAAAAAPGPCGSCGHPDGPGACAFG